MNRFSNKSDHESLRSAFGPIFKTFKNPSLAQRGELCSKQARERNLDYFAITKGGCRGDVHTGLTYRKYGSLSDCDGEIAKSGVGIVYGNKFCFYFAFIDRTIRSGLIYI